MDINRLLVSQPATPHLKISTPTYPGSPAPGSTVPSSSAELAAIQEELQTVLEYVDHGMILKSFDTLSRLTDIVVTNCEQLGLVSDNASISTSTTTTSITATQEVDQKSGFWTGLNNCWLFAFSHYANARSQDQQLKEPHLHHLHNNVKTWADTLEKYGLVNYEMGLWEQDILEAIEVCLISASLFSSSGMDDIL
ncbi:MAG: hypothetical protein BYD32DRAFT_448755 [Podila humilis]|nr:MAG: hypothetical protein BYD32DRAFT_448755 [Podila humilis]